MFHPSSPQNPEPFGSSLICEAGHIAVARSTRYSSPWLPIIVSTATPDHHLVNDASSSTTGRMANHPSSGLVQKYLQLTSDKDEAKHGHVRTLAAILESLHSPMDEAVPQEVPEASLEDADDEHPLEEPSAPQPPAITTKVADAVHRLLSHLEKRGPTTEDGSRIPLALGILQGAQHRIAISLGRASSDTAS
ncbi:hypothetical protein CCMSSC00406_0004387 [Pleurotus cornucopiae]|uniref:Uncharacterized protein n=1 Tax=Pleurotus cornucopiae TaxID=5321 RepID=A0ACB7J0N0_PLECO|nr:hypothetical protein CCMSSC00406_0004387 [Pleurotus cornucopiae]